MAETWLARADVTWTGSSFWPNVPVFGLFNKSASKVFKVRRVCALPASSIATTQAMLLPVQMGLGHVTQDADAAALTGVTVVPHDSANVALGSHTCGVQDRFETGAAWPTPDFYWKHWHVVTSPAASLVNLSAALVESLVIPFAEIFRATHHAPIELGENEGMVLMQRSAFFLYGHVWGSLEIEFTNE